MSDIDYIRDLLKKFEENINNKEGVEYLRSALADMACIFEEADNEKDIIFLRNAIRKYRNVVTEMAKRVLRKGTASSTESSLIVDLMLPFIENGFDDEPDFKDIHGKIFVEYLEVVFREDGRKLDDAKKVEIYKIITENAD